jgi:hypothetical protein
MTEHVAVDIVNQWPERIKVSGLPLTLCGWNAVFIRADIQQYVFCTLSLGLPTLPTFCTETSDGVPVYVLDSYWLFNCVPIAPAEIIRIDSVWHLRRFETGATFKSHQSECDSGVGGLVCKWGQTGVTIKMC